MSTWNIYIVHSNIYQALIKIFQKQTFSTQPLINWIVDSALSSIGSGCDIPHDHVINVYVLYGTHITFFLFSLIYDCVPVLRILAFLWETQKVNRLRIYLHNLKPYPLDFHIFSWQMGKA